MKQVSLFLFKLCLLVGLGLFSGECLGQNIEWQKCLGGSSYEDAQSIQQTIDGGYIVAGRSKSIDGDITGNHGYYDYWIVKLDANGTLTWQKSLGGSSGDVANAIQQTTDGGYIVVGVSASNDGDVTGNHGVSNDYWIVKLDGNGNVSWQRSLGGSNNDWARSVEQTTDGGYIVAGVSRSNDGDVTGNHGESDFWIVKLDANGNLIWQKSLGGSGNDQAYSIQQTTDGGYIVAGYSDSSDGDLLFSFGGWDYWIVKLDANGTLSWQENLGGGNWDYAYSIEQTTDGGYIVAGKSESNSGVVTGNHGGYDYWIVKLDANGTLSWQKSLGGGGIDEAYSIQQATDGGYIVAGSNGEYWIVKLDSSGNFGWQKSLGGSGAEGAYSVDQTTDGGYIVAGMSLSNDGDVTGNHGGYDVWIVKLFNYGVGVEEASMVGGLSVSPNPVAGNSITVGYHLSGATEVEISIMDVLGNCVLCEEGVLESAGVHRRELGVEGLASGSYFVEVRTEYGVGSSQFIKH